MIITIQGIGSKANEFQNHEVFNKHYKRWNDKEQVMNFYYQHLMTNDYVDKHLPKKNRIFNELFIEILSDSFRYLYHKEVIIEAFKDYISRLDCKTFSLVGISLGSVIAYDICQALPNLNIKLITLGSPIACYYSGKHSKPASVHTWDNYYYPEDYIATKMCLDNVNDIEIKWSFWRLLGSISHAGYAMEKSVIEKI